MDGAFEAELKEDNQRRYERELQEYEVAQTEGRKVRKPRLQRNIRWVQGHYSSFVSPRCT